jgi:hypothetical protein
MPGWLTAVETVLGAALVPQTAEPAPHRLSPRSTAAQVSVSSVQLHEVITLVASLVLSTRPVTH